MKIPLRVAWLLLLALVSLSASPAAEWLEDVRRGNAAFTRADFQGALNCYQRAETYTTDPGLVAFNEGAALYRLGQYVEAERHFLRCREDATGERRARALYNLGNCLVQQAGTEDVALLERAAGFYRECLEQQPADQDLAADTQQNLKLAQALLAAARARKNQESSPQDQDDQHPRPNPPEEKPGPRGADHNESSAESTQGSPQPVSPEPGGSSPRPMATSQNPPPGIGNLKPIPDTDVLVPLSPEETAAYLKQAVERTARERRAHWLPYLQTIPRDMKDW